MLPIRPDVEVKWTENPDARDAQGLETVLRILREHSKRPDVHASIVCRTPHPSLLGNATRVIDLKALGGPD